jgi:hypothetical protein
MSFRFTVARKSGSGVPKRRLAAGGDCLRQASPAKAGASEHHHLNLSARIESLIDKTRRKYAGNI